MGRGEGLQMILNYFWLRILGFTQRFRPLLVVAIVHRLSASSVEHCLHVCLALLLNK